MRRSQRALPRRHEAAIGCGVSRVGGRVRRRGYESVRFPVNVIGCADIAVGGCDRVRTERCDGETDSCPVDLFANPMTVCRPDADVCDVPEQVRRCDTGAVCESAIYSARVRRHSAQLTL
jgi:hypothetical protein